MLHYQAKSAKTNYQKKEIDFIIFEKESKGCFKSESFNEKSSSVSWGEKVIYGLNDRQDNYFRTQSLPLVLIDKGESLNSGASFRKPCPDFISQSIVLIISNLFKQQIKLKIQARMENQSQELSNDESSLWSQLLVTENAKQDEFLFEPLNLQQPDEIQVPKNDDNASFCAPEEQFPLSSIPVPTLQQSCDYSCCDDGLNVLKTKDCLKEEEEQNFGDVIETDEMIRIVYNWSMSMCVPSEKNEQTNVFKSIFEQRDLRRGWKKNTNVPKFITRLFMKHFPDFVAEGDQDLIQVHKEIAKKLLNRESNNYSISDVLMLLRDDDQNENIRRRNQRIMASIIRRTMREQIIENKYIKDNHKSYMMAMKIFSLRCKSRTLTERVKVF